MWLLFFKQGEKVDFGTTEENFSKSSVVHDKCKIEGSPMVYMWKSEI